MAKKAQPSSKRVAKPADGKWTVMVYMAAELSPELDAHAVRDLREMELATIDPGVRVVVQINRNWPRLPQRYEIAGGKTTLVGPDVEDDNTGSGRTLSKFLTLVADQDKKAAPRERDRQYFLLLWGHSFGLGFGRDHGDPLTLRELQGALGALSYQRGGAPLDLLGANACAFSYAEAAFELRALARHLVASQIAVPFAGWPFEALLTAVRPGMTSEEVGRLAVDRYVSSFQASTSGRYVAMSLLDLTQLNTPHPPPGSRDLPFDALLRNLAKALVDAVSGSDPGATDRLAYVRAAFLSTAVGDVRPLIDLHDLCKQIGTLCEDLDILQPNVPAVAALTAAAVGVKAFLAAAYDLCPGKALHRLTLNRLIVLHKQHEELHGLNGLGIFAPFVTDPADLKRLGLATDDPHVGRTAYAALDLMRGSQWTSLVYDVLKAGIPTDMVNYVETGVTADRADRAAIAQMLVAIDSLFDVLDRRIAAARLTTAAAVPPPNGAGGAGPIGPDPFLELQLLRHKDVRKTAKASMASLKGAPLGGPTPAVNTAVKSLRALEDMLSSLERATHRTLTNGKFGLGPGPGGSVSLPGSHGKGGGVHGGPDFDKGGGVHGAPDDKGGGVHGAPGDKGGGVHGPAVSGTGAALSIGTLSSTPASVIAVLFEQVGETMAVLEAAVGEVETLLALANTSGGAVTNGGPPNAMQIERAFRVVTDASIQARRTVRRVLTDPSYGFGPGAAGVGVEDRKELARAGGLSSMQLRLL